MKFEIGTCFLGAPSAMDAAKVAEVVARYVDQEEGTARWNGGALFGLRSTEVFFGTRRGHTNVNFDVKLPSFTVARELVKELSQVTGKSWNGPTQDRDEIEASFGETYGMFSEDGARAVYQMLQLLEQSLRNGTLSPVKLEDAVELHCKAISNEGHDEVFDTAVREEIWDRLDKVLDDLGVRLDVR